MTETFLFTQERLRKLPLPNKGRVEYHDTKQAKLRLRVSASGIQTFAVVKKVYGKTKRVTIGRWPEVSIASAREHAIHILEKLRLGEDPVEEKRKKRLQKITLSEALEQYLAERDLKSNTVENYRYKLKLGFVDWLDMPLSSITQDMVLRRHKQLTNRGKTTANTTMRVLRLTLNYAVALGVLEQNPTAILSNARMWHKNNRKDRLIPSNKLAAWHAAVIELTNPKAKTYLLMLIYMGFRSSEALTLRWRDVDLQANLIRLDNTKNRTSHTLPIPSPIKSELMELKALSFLSDWVFPSQNGLNHMSIPTKPIQTVIRQSGVLFSPHDCRRTFATIAEAVNLPLTMIKRLMNHSTTNDVTGGYIVTEEQTLRAAIEKIAYYIHSRVSQKNNVVELITANAEVK